MNSKQECHLLLLLVTFFCPSFLCIARNQSHYIPLKWSLCPSLPNREQRQEQGRLLSLAGPAAINECIPASVPGTALANLLVNETFGFRDPFFQTNLKRIPDINETGRDAWTFFYIATFDIQHHQSQEEARQQALLTLRSINYKAELWLDGVPIVPQNFPGVPDPESVQGMFKRFHFPLGTLESKRHFLAILIHPPPHPGSPGGGQGGSHDLALDGPVSQFTAGWDWIQASPDRNTGIWDKAFLKLIPGSLQLHDPTVRIRNIHIPTSEADLYFSVSIVSRNLEADTCTLIALQYNLASPPGIFRPVSPTVRRVLQVNVPKGANKVSADFPVETLQNAQFWYPHTHGQPILYQAKFGVRTVLCNQDPSPDSNLLYSNDSTFQDELLFRFGIRKVNFTVNSEVGGGLQLELNDEKVFLQGGNWIATDQFMRFAGDPIRYKAEVGMHKAMGMNMIRTWGGGITERPEFFHVCDEMGMMVLSDFWMSGDNNGRWAGSYLSPLNHSLYLAAVNDTILLLRNHPSLVMYSAGNELYPTNKSPPEPVLVGIKNALRNIDPDTFLIVSTMTNASCFNASHSLAPKDGPYGMLEEEFFYERNPGLWDWKEHKHARFNYSNVVFQPEIGSVSFPSLASLRRFMSNQTANSFPGFEDSNVNHVWDYHNFIGFTSDRLPFDPTNSIKVDHIYKYGIPTNISEYAFRAQLAQFTQYRSLFESFKLKMFKWYTAVLFWKSQSPWPSLRGGLYDYFLAVTGGYYGVRAALVGGGSATGMDLYERGRVHVQMNLGDHALAVVASPHKSQHHVSVCATVNVYVLAGDESGKKMFSNAFSLSVETNSAIDIPNSTIPWLGGNEFKVLLYRITTYTRNHSDNEQEQLTASCQGLALGVQHEDSQWSDNGKSISSIAEYWLSDFTSVGNTQDLSALGEWRENLSMYVSLDVDAGWCDCLAKGDLCLQARCSTSEIAVRITNKGTGRNSTSGEFDAIAFAVSIELHFAERRGKADTRVLPTFYSDGLFSILKNEERFVCVSPSLGSKAAGEELNLHVTAWNTHHTKKRVSQRCQQDSAVDRK